MKYFSVFWAKYLFNVFIIFFFCFLPPLRVVFHLVSNHEIIFFVEIDIHCVYFLFLFLFLFIFRYHFLFICIMNFFFVCAYFCYAEKEMNTFKSYIIDHLFNFWDFYWFNNNIYVDLFFHLTFIHQLSLTENQNDVN